MRGIPEELPRIVYERAQKRFFDVQSGLEIAVLRTLFNAKVRDVAVAHRKDADTVLLVTVHPLKSGQLENRIRSGRWKKI